METAVGRNPDDSAVDASVPQPRHRARSNALWNVGRALSTAVVGFFTTPILLHRFSDGDYAGWVLVGSVTSYLTITDIGLAAEVVRATAADRADGGRDPGFDTLKAVLILQAGFALLMFGLLGAVTLAFPHVFHSIPDASVRRSQWALLMLGITSIAQMALNPLVARQIGIDRVDVGAKAMMASRLLVLVWIVATARRGLAVVSTGVAALYTGGFVIACLWTYRLFPGFRLRHPFRGATPYASVLTFARRRLVWFLGYFAAITFDVTIIGRYAFDELVPFSLALSLVTVCSMAFDAILGSLMPQIPGLRGEALGSWFNAFYLLGLGVSAILVFGMGATSVIAVPLWVGSSMSKRVLLLLFPMLLVAFVRLVLDVLTAFLIGRNEQRRCMWNHVLEAAVKLPLGLVLVTHLGAIGLLWAGLAGAVAGSALALASSLRLRIGATALSVFGPYLAALGLAGAAMLVARRADGPAQFAIMAAGVALVAAGIVRSGVLRTLGLGRRPH